MKYYTPELYNWWRTLGGPGQRVMSSLGGVNESYASPEVPLGYYTPDTATPVDGCYPYGMGPSFEAMMQKAGDTQGWLWFNIPRAATPAYGAMLIRLAIALYPDLHIVFQLSNEVFNFGFAQSTFMLLEGLRRGLGQESATYGQNAGLTIPDTLPTVRPTAEFPEGTRRMYAGSPWVRVGTQDVNFMPGETGSGWDREQRGDWAQKRHLAELSRAMVDAMRTEAGDDLWGSRYLFTADTWQGSPDWARDVLEWGPETGSAEAGGIVPRDMLIHHVHGVASANYFGGTVASYNDHIGQPIVEAAPGLARQTAMLDAMQADARLQLGIFSGFQTWIAAINAEHGADVEGMGYEGGNGLAAIWAGDEAMASSDPTFRLAWYADVQAMYDSDRCRQIYGDTLIAQAEEAGGHNVWFMDFQNRLGNPNYFYQYWGIAENPSDLTSPRRLAFQDAMKACGVYVPLDPGGRRRPAQQLRRLAA